LNERQNEKNKRHIVQRRFMKQEKNIEKNEQ